MTVLIKQKDITYFWGRQNSMKTCHNMDTKAKLDMSIFYEEFLKLTQQQKSHRAG